MKDQANDFRTPEEREFYVLVDAAVPDLDWWRRGSPGAPWLCVSFDVVAGEQIAKTLRLDFDGAEICGGWSPACLDGDDGVRAREAGVDLEPPDGICAKGNPRELARLTVDFFRGHLSRETGAHELKPSN